MTQPLSHILPPRAPGRAGDKGNLVLQCFHGLFLYIDLVVFNGASLKSFKGSQSIENLFRLQAIAVVHIDKSECDRAVAVDHVGGRNRQQPGT
jgi:hypothetical protein